MSKAETDLLRVGAALWGAVMREGPSPAADTRAALQAIRASLDAARVLRFAGAMTDEEQRRLTRRAAEAAERQERALWLWFAGRGLDPPSACAAADLPAERPGDLVSTQAAESAG